MKFRIAIENDLPAIVELLSDDPIGQTREVSSDPLPEVYMSAFAAIEAQSGNQIIVACDDADHVRACLQLSLTPGLARMGMKRATIEGVRVGKSVRGTGLGQALIEHAVSIAKDNHCGLIQLTTDKSRHNAHGFYENMGFVPSHIGMKKKL